MIRFIEAYPTRALVSRVPDVEAVLPGHLELAERMLYLITHNERRGVGLAANQVGDMVRMFVWCIDGQSGRQSGVVFNPEILEYSPETSMAMEGCLSLPVQFLVGVVRSKRIRVRWMTPDGVIVDKHIIDEYKARVWQHEIDHLNGLSIVDTMTSSWKRKKRTKLASIMTARRLLEEQVIGRAS